MERTRGPQPWRRVVHAASGLALALLPGAFEVPRPALLAVLAALLVAAVVLDVARLRYRPLNLLFFRLLSPLASPREARGFASSTWYLLGGLLVYLFLPGQAVPAILVLGLADPAASIVGGRWGGRPLGKGSYVGGLTFFGVAACVLYVTVGGTAALVTAAVAAAVELLPLRVDDNLSVPVVTALLLAAMGA